MKTLTSYNHCQELADCGCGAEPVHESIACMLKYRYREVFDRSSLASLGAEGEVTPLTLPPLGCNALLELLALHECLWTKRRHPKHIGRSACHCRQPEPQTSLFKHNPADPTEKHSDL